MNRITTARTRTEHAHDLPGLLAAACIAFDDMLHVIRHHEERDEGSFAAFVLAAAAAANARDHIAAAPSLPPIATASQAPGEQALLAGSSVGHVARALAALSDLLATRLAAAAAMTTNPGDHAACTHAARHANRISALLGGAREP